MIILAGLAFEEAGEVDGEDIGSVKDGAVGDEVTEQDVADHVVGLGRGVLLGDGLERQQRGDVGVGIAHVDTQGDVGSVDRTVGIGHLFVFVAVVVLTRHDIAENRRGGGETSGTFAEHELAVVALAAYHHAVVFVVDAINVTRRAYKLGHDKHGEQFGGDFHNLRHKLDFYALFAGIAYVGIVNVGYAVGEDVGRRHIYAEGVDGDDDEFEERVEPLDVKRRVALGESELLGATQSFVV